jgi:hypothetical protein
MIRNMGTADRIIRTIIGIALLVATFGMGIGTGWVHWAMAAVGVAMLLAAITARCPPYALLGIKTCRT